MSALVFVPGLNNDAKVWDRVIAALPADLDARAVDVPALPDLVQITDELQASVPDGSVVVGHSFGGVVAMALAERYPAKVSALVLVNTPCSTDTPEMAEQRRAKGEEALAGKFEEFAMGRVELVFYGDNAKDPEILAERLRGLRGYGAERYRAHSYALASRPDPTPFLTSLDLPILIVAASHDLAVPTAEQRQLASDVGADYREVARTAHMLPAESPRELADFVADWVRELDDAHHDVEKDES